MLKLAVLVSGGGTNLQAIIDSIADGRITNAEIKVVISNNKNAYALERAAKAEIPAKALSPKDFPDREAFNEALLQALIDSEGDRIINIHPSLIPSFCGKDYYGLKVHEGVLNRGVKVTGATVHFVDDGTDTGPIILQKAVEVHQDDTPKSLQLRVMEEAEWVIMPRAIDLIANGKVKVEGGKALIEQ